MVEPQPIDYHFRRKRLDWPLHVTILPWFTVIEKSVALDDIKQVITDTHSFELIIGPEELFGETKVNLIGQPGKVEALHETLLEVSANNIVFSKDPEWIGNQYRPHVTHHGAERLYEGDTVTVGAVTIVQLIPNNMCQVIDTIHLKV